MKGCAPNDLATGLTCRHILASRLNLEMHLASQLSHSQPLIDWTLHTSH